MNLKYRIAQITINDTKAILIHWKFSIGNLGRLTVTIRYKHLDFNFFN